MFLRNIATHCYRKLKSQKDCLGVGGDGGGRRQRQINANALEGTYCLHLQSEERETAGFSLYPPQYTVSLLIWCYPSVYCHNSYMVLLCSTFNSISSVNCRDGAWRLHGPRSGGRKAGGAGQLLPNMRSHHVHISGSLHNPSCDCLDDMETNK